MHRVAIADPPEPCGPCSATNKGRLGDWFDNSRLAERRDTISVQMTVSSSGKALPDCIVSLMVVTQVRRHDRVGDKIIDGMMNKLHECVVPSG